MTRNSLETLQTQTFDSIDQENECETMNSVSDMTVTVVSVCSQPTLHHLPRELANQHVIICQLS